MKKQLINLVLICLCISHLALAQATLPAISSGLDINAYNGKWTFWTETVCAKSTVTINPSGTNVGTVPSVSYLDANGNPTTQNISYIGAGYYEDKSWSLYPHNYYENLGFTAGAYNGDVYTFTAVIAGNSLGDISTPDAFIGFVEYDASSTATNWFSNVKKIPSGTFGWTVVTATFTKPTNSSTTKIQPRIYANKGGGEIFVCYTNLKKGALQDGGPIMPGKAPSSLLNNLIKPNPVFGNAYAPGASDTWNYYINGQTTPYTKVQYRSSPLNHFAFSVEQNVSWSLYPARKSTDDCSASNDFWAVKPGYTYTFTAIIAANSLGELNNTNNYNNNIGFVLCDQNKIALTTNGYNIGNVPLPKGTFGWTKVTASYTVPSNSTAKYIYPRLCGDAGGEIYVADARMAMVKSELPLNAEANENVGPPRSLGSDVPIICLPSSGNTLPTGWSIDLSAESYTATVSTLSPTSPQKYLSISSNTTFNLSTDFMPVDAGSTGTSYYYSVYASGVKGSSCSPNFNLYAYDGNKTLLSSPQVLNWPVTSGSQNIFDWTKVFNGASFALPANSPVKFIKFKFTGCGALSIAKPQLIKVSPSVGTLSNAVTLPQISVAEDISLQKAGTADLSGWTGYIEKNQYRTSYSAHKSPVNHLAVRMYNNSVWHLYPKNPVTVTPGQSYVMTVVASGKNIGLMENGGFHLGYVNMTSGQEFSSSSYGVQGTTNVATVTGCTSTGNCNVVNGTINGWQTYYFAFTVPAGVTQIRPEIRGWGGGEFYLHTATLLPGSAAASLPVPSNTLPAPPSGQFVYDLYHANPRFEYERSKEYLPNVYTLHNGNPIVLDAQKCGSGFYTVGTNVVWKVDKCSPISSSLYTLPTPIPYKIINKDDNSVVYQDYITTLPYNTPSIAQLQAGFYSLEIDYAANVSNTSNNFYKIKGSYGAIVNENYTSPNWNSSRFGMSIMKENIGSHITDLNAYLGLGWMKANELDITYCEDATKRTSELPTINSPATYNAYALNWQNYLSGTNHACEGQNFNVYYDLSQAKYSNTMEIYGEVDWALFKENMVATNQPKYCHMLAATRKGFNDHNSPLAPANKKSIAVNVLDYYGVNIINSCTTSTSVTGGTQVLYGKNLYDILTVHAYSLYAYKGFSVSPEGKITNGQDYSTLYDPWGNAMSTPDVSGCCVPILEYLARIRNQFTNPTTMDGKKLWVSEYGWPSYPGYSWSTSEDDQAKWTVRSGLLQLASRAEKVMANCFIETDGYSVFDDSYGLYRKNGFPKPGLRAFSTLAKTIKNATYSGYFDTGAGSNIACLLFDNGNGTSTIAAWSADPNTSPTLMTNVAGTLVKMYGNTATATDTSFTLSTSPIYIKINSMYSGTLSINGSSKTFNTGIMPQSIFNVTK